MRKYFLIALLCLGCCISCEKYDVPGLLFGSSPDANARFAESKAYNDKNGFRTISVPANDYKVAVASDAHVSTTAKGLQSFVSYVGSIKAPIALYLGDAVEGKGHYGLFLDTVAPLASSGCSLFCTPGNHDLYHGQWTDFIKAQKTASYYFEVVTPSAGKDLYICLDSASGTLGTSQRQWLEGVLSAAKGKYRYITVFTHTHFFKRDNSQGHTSNFNLEEGYDLCKLFKDCGVGLVLSGHDHSFEEVTFKDVRYVSIASVSDRYEEKFVYTLEVSSTSQGSDGNSGSHLKLNPIPIV